ncbi:MAG: L-threonylcarbamoyladenylate synthase [Gaiellaceae bacterium]
MSGTDPSVERAVDALRAGGVAIIATDTVYGLVARASDATATARIYELKQRPASMPLAVLMHDVEALLSALGELDERTRRAITATLPGAYTLVIPAPESRFASLATEAGLGVRVPHLSKRANAVAEAVGPLASTSANSHGGADAARVADVPQRVRAGVDAILDDGRLPGTPSTVVDLTGREPRVLREGAIPSAVAISALESIDS